MMPAKTEGKCWKCTKCGWVDCYSAQDLATYGEPSECQDNYHESLVEIDLVEGWSVLSDKAAIEVRKASRALHDAKANLETVEGELAHVMGLKD